MRSRCNVRVGDRRHDTYVSHERGSERGMRGTWLESVVMDSGTNLIHRFFGDCSTMASCG
jgi:hypothetical protein